MARMSFRTMKFAKVYPLYVQKVERKGRTKDAVDEVTCWLTGYDTAGLQDQIARETDFETFFAEAPQLNPNRTIITGMICGHRVEDIEDPVERNVRYLDKLVDEVAKGKAMDKIKRR
ncbi:MAG: DUF2200 domain-containing protein [Croceibacterium sp.]